MWNPKKGDYENSLFEPCSVISYGNQLRYFYYKKIDFFCQEWRGTKMNKKYYLGLDIGTNSVGWAVTDENYNLYKYAGKRMWGIRLFEAADTAAERRMKRSNRRRLSRKKQRIDLLQELFSKEIAKKDPTFFIRLNESGLHLEDKSTGEKLNIEGSSAEKTFTPESSDGMVEMLYNIDSTDVAGREIVVFEDLFLDGKLIATHRDLNDENQTVSFPAISTKAGNHNGEKTVAHGENITIIDRISYFNLESGKEYSLRGSIINKNTGEMLDTSAHEKFIAEENGEVHVHFSASTHGLSDQEIVIFEELTDENGVTLIEHSDINNKDQTLKVLKEEKSIPVKPVETGDSIQGLRLWHIMAIISIAGISLTVIIRKVMR